MKSGLKVNLVYFLAVSLALLGGDRALTCACHADQRPAANANQEVKGIDCAIEQGKNDPGSIVVTFYDIAVSNDPFSLRFKFHVVNQKGEEQSLTSYGKYLFGRPLRSGYSPLIIKSGAKYTRNIPLLRLFDLSSPGKYKVSVVAMVDVRTLEQPIAGPKAHTYLLSARESSDAIGSTEGRHLFNDAPHGQIVQVSKAETVHSNEIEIVLPEWPDSGKMSLSVQP